MSSIVNYYDPDLYTMLRLLFGMSLFLLVFVGHCCGRLALFI